MEMTLAERREWEVARLIMLARESFGARIPDDSEEVSYRETLCVNRLGIDPIDPFKGSGGGGG